MKRLLLLRLTLSNFKGCKYFELDIDGKNANVYGDNGTFKTTLYDALLWLFFGKDSSFKTQFEIKTLNADGTPQHNLSHEVKGLFNWDGRAIELRKVFKEIWTKKRGSAAPEFSGHETSHFVDGVPVNKRDYEKRIGEIATEDQFKLLTNPFYFPAIMKWQDRRALLMAMCGDINKQDLSALSEKYAPLVQIMRQRTIEDHRKIVMARRKEINDQLATLPARIDEVVRSLDDVSGINHLAEIERINSLSADLEKIEARISSLKSGGIVADLRRQLAEANTELLNCENARNKEQRFLDDERQKEITKDEREILNAENTINALGINIRTNNEAADALAAKIQTLVDEWKSLDQVSQIDTICPTCGQDLPEEKVAEIVAANNQRISERKAAIDQQGKATREQLTSTNTKIASLIEEKEEAKKRLASLKESLEELKKSEPAQASILPELVCARERVANLQARIAGEEDGLQGETPELTAALESAQACRDAIAASQAKVAKVEASQKAQDRKAALEAEEKTMTAELERIEKELFLIDEFTREKVEILESKVNGLFKLARFKLFSEQVNGGVAECCSVTYNGVPFETSLNNGARINVGLDIIDTISKHSGLSLPVVVDNAESVTSLPEMDAQVVRLVVSEQDKNLTVEVIE